MAIDKEQTYRRLMSKISASVMKALNEGYDIDEETPDYDEDEIYDNEDEENEDDTWEDVSQFDEAAEALADYLDIFVSDLKVSTEDSKLYLNTSDDEGAQYVVYCDEDAAKEAAINKEVDEIEEYGIEGINFDYLGGIEKFIKMDWFDDAMKESFETYADDIDGEEDDSGEYETRLEKEMADQDCATVEQFVQKMCDGENSSYEWYKFNYGMNTLSKTVKDNNLVHTKKLAEAIIEQDGIGSILATYDGEEMELNNGYMAYRTE